MREEVEPPRSDEVQDEVVNAEETSTKRSAEDAGHEADDAGRGGVQHDRDSMADDSMSELRREAESLGADALALAEAYSLASQQRAGAFGLSAGVAMDLRLGLDLGRELTKAQKRWSVEKPHLLLIFFFESQTLGFLSVADAQHQARRVGRTAGAGQTSLAVCMQSGRIANRAMWTRSL